MFFTIDNNFEMVLITWRSSKRGKKKREREGGEIGGEREVPEA